MTNKKLKILQFNIASLRLRTNELREMVIRLQPDVICLSETRFQTTTQLPRITNYEGIGRNTHRGVAIYVKNHIVWNQVDVETENFENIGIKIGNINIFFSLQALQSRPRLR